MNFLYNTVFGRFILLLMLHTKALKIAAVWVNSPLSKGMIGRFIRKHNIDMSEFAGQKYRSYADFFARKKEHIDFDKAEDSFISPCDSLLSTLDIDEKSLFNVKGSWYKLTDLVSDPKTAQSFVGGLCMIYRLQATDYHHFCYVDDCFHRDGELIPGLLHSVQPIALEKEPVFRVNKRHWSIMETKNFGPIAQIEVGAVLVGDIIHEKRNADAKRGEEMGHFGLCGSTIVLLLTKEAKDKIKFIESVELNRNKDFEVPVKLGQVVGTKR